MDMRKYAVRYVKPDQVRDGPIQAHILSVFESEKYGRPVLELSNGAQFMLNESNVDALIKAWGISSEDWTEGEIELSLGTYRDWREKPPVDKETVKVRALSPAETAHNGGAPTLPPSRVVTLYKDDMDDAIPF